MNKWKIALKKNKIYFHFPVLKTGKKKKWILMRKNHLFKKKEVKKGKLNLLQLIILKNVKIIFLPFH